MSNPNKTRETLEGVPFSSIKELKEFKDAVERKAFEKVIKAKFIKEISQKEEYSFWEKEFENGFSCMYGDREIMKVNRKEDGGMGISISTSIAQLPEEIIEILFKSGALIKAVSGSFADTYYRINGFLADKDELENFTDFSDR